jgi:hypothetical protein
MDIQMANIRVMEIRLSVLHKNLEKKIKHNLSVGIYGQSCYLEDCFEIRMLEEKIAKVKEELENQS